MRNLTVAATQMACCWDADANIAAAESLVRQAADLGAQIILLQELFQTPYFCQEQRAEYLRLAQPTSTDRAVQHFSSLAQTLNVVLPVSYFERSGEAAYNSLAILDADGALLWNYRKSHIPQNPGYEEKFYFTPGDTGFRAIDTRHGRIGCGICWDQWFPETARSLALQGAEVLLFPTAIGSEPLDPDVDSMAHWQRTMQGHAAANMVPLVASNRVGTEVIGSSAITFYGSSFIADATGAKVAEANRSETAVLTATFDLDVIQAFRRSWGTFRDRRPALYGALRTLDGETIAAGA